MELDLVYWLLYGFTGLVTGVLAGLMGVGGGLVIVPALSLILDAQGFPQAYLAHAALGTSLATIVFTSISSFRAHHKRGAVNWRIVRDITIGILAGTFFGAWVAAQLSTNFLKIFFAIFLYFVSAQMFLDIKPKGSRELPGFLGTNFVGVLIGLVSALVGIGGGTMSVPFMIWCNVHTRNAIGTSAAIGLPIAVAGAAGYLVNGLGAPGLPAHTLGFIYLPALVGIALLSILTAPLGAKLAHTLPVPVLKKGFAALLVIMATRMLWGAL
ncbi:MAG: sulfite exporter TauE/SafE family protein [Thermodesulfobacteriota bacterium]